MRENYLKDIKLKIFLLLLVSLFVWFLIPSKADMMRRKSFTVKNENNAVKTFDGFVEPEIPDNRANDSSLLGIDKNNNGIRDDIEIWINRTWSTYNERMALRQFAQDLQYRLVSARENTEASIAHSMSMSYTSSMCLAFFWGFNKSEKIIKDLEVLTYNTRERENTLDNFKNFSYSFGSVVPGMHIGEEYKACRFKIENEKKLKESYINNHKKN